MKKNLGFILFFCSLILIFGQNNFEKFKDLYQKGDTVAAEKLLESWEQNNPDAEFYVSAVNYYFNKSQKETLEIGQKTPKEEGFAIKDDNGKTVAFLSSKNTFDTKLLEKTFKYFNEGISRFPERLDIRFGKIFVLGEIEDYEHFTQEIVKTIEHSNQNKNNWLWSENQKYKEGEKGFLSTIQSYNNQIYETNDDALLKYMKILNEEVLKYYPNHVESLSNLSIVSMINKNYDDALIYLLKAEKMAPKDPIVLNNIAYAYKMKNDKENAAKYYELTKKYGDAIAKQQAEIELKNLKK